MISKLLFNDLVTSGAIAADGALHPSSSQPELAAALSYVRSSELTDAPLNPLLPSMGWSRGIHLSDCGHYLYIAESATTRKPGGVHRFKRNKSGEWIAMPDAMPSGTPVISGIIGQVGNNLVIKDTANNIQLRDLVTFELVGEVDHEPINTLSLIPETKKAILLSANNSFDPATGTGTITSENYWIVDLESMTISDIKPNAYGIFQLLTNVSGGISLLAHSFNPAISTQREIIVYDSKGDTWRTMEPAIPENEGVYDLSWCPDSDRLFMTVTSPNSSAIGGIHVFDAAGFMSGAPPIRSFYEFYHDGTKTARARSHPDGRGGCFFFADEVTPAESSWQGKNIIHIAEDMSVQTAFAAASEGLFSPRSVLDKAGLKAIFFFPNSRVSTIDLFAAPPEGYFYAPKIADKNGFPVKIAAD